MSTLPTPTLGGILQQTREETQLPLSELRILLGFVMNMDRIALITRDQDPIPMDKLSDFKSLAARRFQGEPIAYLVGEREFFSRPFKVSPDVLIPRPETEELVERALAFLGNRSNANLLTRVLDIGTGSGAIAITLALENPILEITGCDISEAALDIARQNAAFLKASNVQFVHSNVFSAFESSGTAHSMTDSATHSRTQKAASSTLWQFDLILSNPPYIRSGDAHLSQGDLRFEPQIALTDHADGLSFYRAIAQKSPQFLRPRGAVMVEHGYDQQLQIIEIFKQAGYPQVHGFNDLAGTPRIVVASR
jgi:release factor glutamine methyltransferase